MPATIVGDPITESNSYDGYRIDNFFIDDVNKNLRINYTYHVQGDDVDVFNGKSCVKCYKGDDYDAEVAKYPTLYTNMKNSLYTEMDSVLGVSSSVS